MILVLPHDAAAFLSVPFRPLIACALLQTGGVSALLAAAALAVLLIAALTATTWRYARVNQASIAALHALAEHLRHQGQLIGEELVVMRQQLDLMRHQWDDERRGRLEFWLTAVDDEELRMPFKPPFGSKRNTYVSGWVLESWNPSSHLVRLLECTIRHAETGIEEQVSGIRLIRAETAWVLPLTEILTGMLGRINDVRDQGNWKRLTETPVTLQITLRFQGNDGQEHSLSHNYDAQLGGGWERFELILTPQGSPATPGTATLIGSAIHG